MPSHPLAPGQNSSVQRTSPRRSTGSAPQRTQRYMKRSSLAPHTAHPNTELLLGWFAFCSLWTGTILPVPLDTSSGAASPAPCTMPCTCLQGLQFHPAPAHEKAAPKTFCQAGQGCNSSQQLARGGQMGRVWKRELKRSVHVQLPTGKVNIMYYTRVLTNSTHRPLE